MSVLLWVAIRNKMLPECSLDLSYDDDDDDGIQLSCYTVVMKHA